MISVLSSVSSSLARFNIVVDPGDWVTLYDRLEIWRSTLGRDGPYEELSGNGFVQAFLPFTAGAPGTGPGASANVSGLDLELLINELYDITVTLTGNNPLTLAQIAAQLTTALHPYAISYVDTNSLLAIQSVMAGGLSAVRVVGGDAAPLIGLTIGDVEYGHDPRPPLVQGQMSYAFRDYFSDSTFFYKTRFSNSTTNLASPFFNPFSTADRLGLDPSLVTLGYVQLATAEGRSPQFQEVLVHYSFLGQQVGGALITGNPKRYLTDVNGYVEFPLVRGIKIDVSVGGTALVRTVNVPTDPTIQKFNVFDPEFGRDDNFAVQRAQLPYATRTRL